MGGDNCDLMMHTQEYDRSPAEYECKECYSEFKFSGTDGPAFCPSCGRSVVRVFDLEEGRHKREEGRRRFPVKAQPWPWDSGLWHVEVCDKHRNDLGEIELSTWRTSDHFQWRYLDRLRELLALRDRYLSQENVVSAKIIREAGQNKPALP